MSTIDDKSLIIQLLKNDGHYEDDPQAESIWAYINIEGRLTYSVFWQNVHDMATSSYVSHPVLLWRKRDGLTVIGRKMIENEI